MNPFDPEIHLETHRLLLDISRCEPVSPCVALKQASLAAVNGSEAFQPEIARGFELAGLQGNADLKASYAMVLAILEQLPRPTHT